MEILRIRDEIYYIDALYPKDGSVAEPRRNLSELRRVCSRNIENI